MTGLYHYTCRDGAKAIAADGWTLRPNRVPFGLLWLTDLATPDRLALGLTSHALTCDRTAVQLRVAPGVPVRWVDWCRSVRLPRVVRDELELAPGAQPLRWWVSTVPLACQL